jgi:hypothetical protein
MSSSTIAIVIACISGAVSLTAAFGVEWVRQRSNRAKDAQESQLADLKLEQDSAKLAQDQELANLKLAQDKELANLKLAQDKELEEFRNKSALALEEAKDQMARSREAATKAEDAARVIAKYRDPLLRSAYDLQSRIYNVYRSGGFRGYRDPEYFRLNTAFLFGEFLAWLEIIRREIQFLNLGAVQATKDLSHALQEVQDRLATTSRLRDEFYLYRGQQRAIGELMLVRTDGRTADGPRYEWMGYAKFVEAHEDPAFAKWFTRLGDAIDKLRENKPERLVWVQHALIDLIDLLDPEHDLFEQDRNRLPAPYSK